MKKTICILLSMIIFTLIFISCAEQGFAEPDKIIIYKSGSTQTVSKDDKLFSDIVSQMNYRVEKDTDILKLGIDEIDMITIKQNEVVVEFVYLKKQKSKVGRVKKRHSNLIFPLTGETKELCFFEENSNNYSGPLGSLKNSDILLDLLK
jgi:hypothetical protein